MATTTPFPASQKDLNELKTTASDAVSDLASTARAHADKAAQGLRSLSGHVQEEGGEQFGQLRDRAGSIVSDAAALIADRPLAFIGGALLVGFLFGLSRRNSRD